MSRCTSLPPDPDAGQVAACGLQGRCAGL